MHALIVYEHCSPHQVTAIEAARQHFRKSGSELTSVEFFSRSIDYGWTFQDKHRPDDWVCLFPGKEVVEEKSKYRAVKKLIIERKPDVVILNGWYSRFVWWIRLLKFLFPCKFVIVSDSVYWDHPRSIYKEWLKSWLLKGFDAAFVAGTLQCNYLNKLGFPSSRMAFGNDVVDNHMYLGIPIKTNCIEGSTIVFGTAARLIPKKNLVEALYAFQTVCKNYSSLKLEWHIAGTGPLEEQLKLLAHTLNVPVVFKGFVGYDDMPQFYSSLNLYWQPSYSEPWGLVINEAMASGLPVLASERCGCVADLISKQTGWVHGIDRASMIKGLSEAIHSRHDWSTMGHAAREHIQLWGLSKFAEGCHQCCQLALNSNTRPKPTNA